MTYLDLINQFWKLNKEYVFSANETQLYFKLLDTCNSLNWKNPFTHSNGFICGELGISEKTLRTARQQLVNYGLIEFKSVTMKKQMIVYTIKTSPNGNTRPTCQEVRPTEHSGEYECTNEAGADSQNEAGAGSHYTPQTDTPPGTPTGTPTGAEIPDILRVTIDKDKDKKRKKRESKDSLSSRDDLEALVQDVFDKYNLICKNVVAAKILTENRKKLLRVRLREYGYETIISMLNNVARSDFLGGSNKRKWVATFDWIFTPSNFVKILEGTYNNRATGYSFENYNARPSNLEIIEETYNNLMADEKYNNCR